MKLKTGMKLGRGFLRWRRELPFHALDLQVSLANGRRESREGLLSRCAGSVDFERSARFLDFGAETIGLPGFTFCDSFSDEVSRANE